MKKLKKFDKKFYTKNIKIIAGVDEAGRGPLAGPVVAAAVIFDKNVFIEGVTDSKKISEKKRELLYEQIVSLCLSYGIGIIDNVRVDKINILQATFAAMRIAVDSLNIKPDLTLVDGNKSYNGSESILPVIKGDSKSFSIAAASILAKVTRDRIMRKSAEKFPVYDWKRNKGYATSKHIAALKKYGITPLHRKSFLGNIFPEQHEFNFYEKK